MWALEKELVVESVLLTREILAHDLGLLSAGVEEGRFNFVASRGAPHVGFVHLYAVGVMMQILEAEIHSWHNEAGQREAEFVSMVSKLNWLALDIHFVTSFGSHLTCCVLGAMSVRSILWHDNIPPVFQWLYNQ